MRLIYLFLFSSASGLSLKQSVEVLRVATNKQQPNPVDMLQMFQVNICWINCLSGLYFQMHTTQKLWLMMSYYLLIKWIRWVIIFCSFGVQLWWHVVGKTPRVCVYRAYCVIEVYEKYLAKDKDLFCHLMDIENAYGKINKKKWTSEII